jgi:hypothetical protein
MEYCKLHSSGNKEVQYTHCHNRNVSLIITTRTRLGSLRIFTKYCSGFALHNAETFRSAGTINRGDKGRYENGGIFRTSHHDRCDMVSPFPTLVRCTSQEQIREIRGQLIIDDSKKIDVSNAFYDQHWPPRKVLTTKGVRLVRLHAWKKLQKRYEARSNQRCIAVGCIYVVCTRN